jgi:hypothetical protein
MKSFSIFLSICFAAIVLYSCNKPVTSYPSATPWSGIDPFSAIVNGKPVAPVSAFYQKTDTGNFVSSSIVIPVNGDTTVTKTFGIRIPAGSPPLNQLIVIDSTNKGYIANYREVLMKGTVVLKDQNYTSYYSEKALSFKVFTLTPKIKGEFNGYLRNANKSNEYVSIESGYFNITN